MKISNFWLLIILSLTITSCAILSGQSPEKVKKNNTFYIYSNVEGAKIEVLNKPEKENFEPTNAKSGSGFYSVNTYSKLRLGRTKLLISKEGYEPDTIKIRRAPRPGVLTADICFFGPLVLLDILSPNFYKISKKSSNQNVYLSPTQDFMRLKYNEISKKSNIADFDDFIKKYPSSDCVSLAKSRRDSILNLNNEIRERYAVISTNNPALIKEFFFKYQLEYLNKSELFTSESFSTLNRVKGQFFYNTLNEFSQITNVSEQSKFIEERKTELQKLGFNFSNSVDLINALTKSSFNIYENTVDVMGYTGEVNLYGQQYTEAYFPKWVAEYYRLSCFRLTQEGKIIESKEGDVEIANTISLISSADKETINMNSGEISKIDGYRNGNLIYSIWFKSNLNKDRLKKYKESSFYDESLRFDNCVIQFFLDPSLVLDGKLDLKYRLRSIHYYYGLRLHSRIIMNYEKGLNEKLDAWQQIGKENWNDEGGDERDKGLASNDWREIAKLESSLATKVLECKELKSQINDEIIPIIGGYKNYCSLCDRLEFWRNELENRKNKLARGGESISNQEITTNFCYEVDYTGNKYELKLYDKESGEGKVVFNLYKGDVLTKTVAGIWEEKYISLGDATKIVCSMDDGRNMEFYLRKYMNGAWQDIQEFDGEQRIWTYCK